MKFPFHDGWTNVQPDKGNDPRLTWQGADAIELLKAQWDANIHYVDGLEIFGAEYVDMLPDELHPDAEGYQVLARNFVDEVATPLFI